MLRVWSPWNIGLNPDKITKYLFFSNVFTPAVGTTKSLTFWTTLGKPTEAWNWPLLSDAEAKNVCSCAYASPYAFVSCCSIKCRDNWHVKTIIWLVIKRSRRIFHTSSEPNLFFGRGRRGGFAVMCLLFNQNARNIATVTFDLKYKEAGKR